MTKKQKVGEEARLVRELLNLKRVKCELQQLYLDPNNPRFGVGKNIQNSRIIEASVQAGAQDKIERIGIDDLISSIRRYGFVPTDLVVVRQFDKDKFVVVEGNRRVGALRKLFASHNKGEITLDHEILNSVINLEVLLYEGTDPDIAWIVQGLRHMSGTKEWPPLQQATFIAKIEKELKKRQRKKRGRPPGLPTVAKAAGVSTSVANRLRRSYFGFKQAREDDEYGEYITNDKFSMFSEAIFRVDELQKWLEWDDEAQRFKNTERLKKFLAWITPPEGGGEPKIVRALDARDVLPGIIENSDLLRAFERGSLDINQARVEIERKRPPPEPDLDSLSAQLKEISNFLDTLPLPKITREKRTKEFKLLLEKLKESIEFQIRHLSE